MKDVENSFIIYKYLSYVKNKYHIGVIVWTWSHTCYVVDINLAVCETNYDWDMFLTSKIEALTLYHAVPTLTHYQTTNFRLF